MTDAHNSSPSTSGTAAQGTLPPEAGIAKLGKKLLRILRGPKDLPPQQLPVSSEPAEQKEEAHESDYYGPARPIESTPPRKVDSQSRAKKRAGRAGRTRERAHAAALRQEVLETEARARAAVAELLGEDAPAPAPILEGGADQRALAIFTRQQAAAEEVASAMDKLVAVMGGAEAAFLTVEDFDATLRLVEKTVGDHQARNFAQAAEENADLRVQLAGATVDQALFQAQSKENTHLRGKIEALERHQAAQQERLKGTAARAAAAEARLAQAEATIKALAEEAAKERKSRQEAERRAALAQEALTNEKAEHERTSQDRDAKGARIDELETQAVHLTDALTSEQAARAVLEGANATFSDLNTEMSRTRIELQAQVAQLKEESVVEELDVTDSAVVTVLPDPLLMELKALRAQLEAEKKARAAEAAEAKKERGRLTEENTSLRAQIQEEAEDAEAVTAALHASHAEKLTDINAAHAAEVASLKADLQAAQDLTQEYRGVLHDLGEPDLSGKTLAPSFDQVAKPKAGEGSAAAVPVRLSQIVEEAANHVEAPVLDTPYPIDNTGGRVKQNQEGPRV